MSFQYQPDRKISREVKTPLLIAAGLIGVPLAIGVVQYLSHDRADEPWDNPSPSAPPTTVNSDTAYPMNHFVPGAGYYHVPNHAWFPFPYNYHDSRGWYRGGQWRGAAAEDAAERSRFVGTSGVSGVGSSASRPLPDAVRRANAGSLARPSGGSHVIRGGFGFSAHPGVS